MLHQSESSRSCPVSAEKAAAPLLAAAKRQDYCALTSASTVQDVEACENSPEADFEIDDPELPADEEWTAHCLSENEEGEEQYPLGATIIKL